MCRHLPEQERWEKVTHPNSAGFYIDFEVWKAIPATPLQYLQRLRLANRHLGDDIRFLGVETGPSQYTTRIRTTQPHVRGEAPSRKTLVSILTSLGFRQEHKAERLGAYDAMTFRRGSLWLFDVRPPNFKQSGDAVLPVDVIVQCTPRQAK